MHTSICRSTSRRRRKNWYDAYCGSKKIIK
jgi:hypothetical protein